MIDGTSGAKGKVVDGVCQVTFKRAEIVQEDGMEVPVAMRSGEAITFQPTGGGKAAITGDFVLTEKEVNPVLRKLQANGIEVTALHNHMLNDEPRLFFMHFWANDDVQKLASGLRQALDQVNLAGARLRSMRSTSSIAAGILAGATFACLAAQAGASETQAPLVLERSIPLADVSCRIDHMAVDLQRGRLFVAELGNNTVDVVDLAAGRVIHRLSGLHEPQGIGYSPFADIVAVANAGDGSVRLYSGADYAAVSRADLEEDADNVRLDTHSGKFLVGYGNGGIATLDLGTGAVLNEVALPAHPEGFRVDANGRRVLANVPDAGQIAVVDLTTRRQMAAWHVPRLHGNFPMAWDETRQVVAVVFRSPARLALLDSKTGSVRSSLRTCGDADDVFFDSRRQRIYVSCGSGSVDVFRREGADYRFAARITTRSGARTSLFVLELDRLFVAARAGTSGSQAAIFVFRPVP